MSANKKPAKKPGGANKPRSDDVKAAFREALARKNSRQHAHNEGGEDTGRVQAHEKASTKRIFRRKSG
ncbi:MAG: DUF5302 domain-containing protein [Mycobacteriales bacterium]